MQTSFLRLRNIRESLPQLRPSERKVAELILQAPDQAARLRLAELAGRAGVSEPTVMRLCRALGFDSHTELRMALTAALVAEDKMAEDAFARRQVTADDSGADTLEKVFEAGIRALVLARRETSPEQLEAAAAALAEASHVAIYAFGGSVPVAMDLQHKLFRLSIPSAVYSDPHLQRMSAVSLGSGELVLAVSNSGTTQTLIESIRFALDSRAPDGKAVQVITLTPPGTPLQRLATLPIDVEVDPPDSILMPISSRLAFLALIDALAIGVAQRLGARAQDNLDAVIRSQEDLRTSRRRR